MNMRNVRTVACTARVLRAIAIFALVSLPAPADAGQPNCSNAGTVIREQKISSTAGGFTGPLRDGDDFGVAAVNVGDIDDDGVTDLAIGAWLDDDGGMDRGAVWVLFMNTDGTVKSSQKISDVAGNLAAALDDSDGFGVGVGSLGDLDEDGVPDLAVGAPSDDDGGTDRGAVYILFLNPNGTVKAEQKISSTSGGFTGVLDNADGFGVGLGEIGDLDGDGVTDIVVGPWLDDDGGFDRGAVYVLLLNTNGTVKATQKISDLVGGLATPLDNADHFGRSAAGIGDLDGDSIPDIAVGADFDDDGGTQSGAVYILFLNSNGTVKAEQKISSFAGGFPGGIGSSQFGVSVSPIGDLDGDGLVDLAVGAFLNDDGGNDKGAAWVLFLNANGTVRAAQRISDLNGGFNGQLDASDFFGSAVAGVGDLDRDCRPDLVVMAFRDDDGGLNRGAAWVLSLNGCLPLDVCCPGNADGLDAVNFADITSVLTNFGLPVTPCMQMPGDANCDGAVNFADITSVLTSFGSACP